MFDIEAEKVSSVLLRNGVWIRVTEGTFKIGVESELFQFEEATGSTATTTVVGRVSDVIAIKRKSHEPPRLRAEFA